MWKTIYASQRRASTLSVEAGSFTYDVTLILKATQPNPFKTSHLTPTHTIHSIILTFWHIQDKLVFLNVFFLILGGEGGVFNYCEKISLKLFQKEL